MSGSLQPVTLASLLPIARASNAWRFNASGVLEQIGADIARLDHDPVTLARRGLLIEPQRTNEIRNPRAEGGTPGVIISSSGGAGDTAFLPTHWRVVYRSGAAVTGLTIESHAFGIEDGIPYAEMSISGTPSISAQICFFGGNPAGGNALLTDGTVYGGAVHARTISGTPTGVNIIHSRHNNAGTFGGGASVPALTAIAPTSGPLSGQRFTLARGTTNSLHPVGCIGLDVAVTGGVAVNWRFRMALPQIERAHTSSPILPPAGSPATSTRLADSLVRTLGVAEFSPQGFTLVAEGLVGEQAEVARHLLALDDDGANNAVAIRIPAASSAVQLVVVNGGVETVTALGSLTPGSPFRVAARCAPGAFLASLNGGAAAGNGAAMPPLTRLRAGRLGPSGTLLRGHLRLATLSRGLRAAAVLPALSVPGAAYL